MHHARHDHPRLDSPLAALRRFARQRPNRERCSLCSADLADEHEHLFEPASRRLHCACTPCAILFGGRKDLKYVRTPRDVTDLTGLRLTDLQWEAFGLPVSLAFFLHNSTAGRMAVVYPSPAGATESLVPLECWEDVARDNPALQNLLPDVEAFLVNRVGSARDYFRVGIDHCYRLVGVMRSHWQGFSGGQALWDEVGRFFDDLRRRGSRGNAVHA